MPGYTVRKLSFEGEIGGSSFTLRGNSFGHFFGGGLSDCSGKFGDGGLQLFVPLANGQTSTLQFKHSTPVLWNKALADFERECSRQALMIQWLRALQTHVSNLKSEVDADQSAEKNLMERLGKLRQNLVDLQAKMGTAEDRIAAAEKVLDDKKADATKAEQLADDAQKLANQNDSQENSDRAAKLAYASAQANYRVTEADYQVTQAKYSRDQVRYSVDRANEARITDEKSLEEAKAGLEWVEREQAVIKQFQPYVKKFIGGALWTGIPIAAGTATRRPIPGSSILASFQKGQALSILPTGPDWCMVLLANQGVGWTDRSNFVIKSN